MNRPQTRSHRLLGYALTGSESREHHHPRSGTKVGEVQVVMLEPDTMHGMAGGETRDTTEGCVVCTRETSGTENRERESVNDYRIADSHF